MKSPGPGHLDALRSYLEAHYGAFDYARHRSRDPVRYLEPFRGRPRDLEVVGFLASALAYGNVSIILKSVQRVLDLLGPEPAAAALSFGTALDRRHWKGFRHRFTSGLDVGFVISALGQVLERHGSLEAVVVRGMHDHETAGRGAAGASRVDVAPGLAALCDELGQADARRVYGGRSSKPPATARYLFASPAGGSACKRLMMFARWMVRRPEAIDGMDHGVWRQVNPDQLLLPLDTHTDRLVRYLGLSPPRRSTGLAMAREVTAQLARLDPSDPVKYDFALAHIGISRACLHRRDPVVCGGCALDPVCLLPGPRRRRTAP